MLRHNFQNKPSEEKSRKFESARKLGILCELSIIVKPLKLNKVGLVFGPEL